jgi:hypothetical protein
MKPPPVGFTLGTNVLFAIASTRLPDKAVTAYPPKATLKADVIVSTLPIDPAIKRK